MMRNNKQKDKTEINKQRRTKRNYNRIMIKEMQKKKKNNYHDNNNKKTIKDRE